MSYNKSIAALTKKLEKLLAIFPLLYGIYRLYYHKVVQREINLGRISRGDRVLCIGGGPCPCTALEIARRTGARVEVVDNDPQVVKHARRVVKRLNMDNMVCVKHAEGELLDVNNFSVVHVALQVHPREEVLKNILRCSSQGVRVLMRAPKDALKKFYSPMGRNLFSQSCGFVKQNGSTMNATLLFVKGGESFSYEEHYKNKKMASSNRGNTAGYRSTLAS